MEGYIHSIESFGAVDGPGIRFVIFMQGCPLRCLYCHNPDTWAVNTGKKMSSDEILAQYDKCKDFLTNGGITVTGGEPLLQIDFVIELFEKAKKKHIHTCVDTSGITFTENNEKFEKLMAVTDLILLDLKHINNEKHTNLTGQPNHNILNFTKYLSDKNIDVWIRHVVIPGITDNEHDLLELGKFIGTLKNVKALDILSYHDMGKSKYKELGMEYPLENIPALNKEEAIKARNIILNGMKRAD